MRKLIVFCFAFVLTQAFCAPAYSQLLQSLIGNQARPMVNSTVWGKKSFSDISFPLHFRSVIKPTSLLVGRNHPNGTRFLAMFPGQGVSLPVDFGKEFGGFGEFGDVNEGYYVQIAEHDFDRDGTPEVVVAVGNGSTDLAVNVMKYHAPQSMKDAGREQNWSLVGSFSGQEKAIISGNTPGSKGSS